MRHAIRDHYGSTVEVIRAEESAKKKKKKRRLAPVNVCSHACHPRDLHPGGRRDADAALQDAGACNSALAAACSFFGRLYTARVLQSPQSRCVVNLCNGHSFFCNAYTVSVAAPTRQGRIRGDARHLPAVLILYATRGVFVLGRRNVPRTSCGRL